MKKIRMFFVELLSLLIPFILFSSGIKCYIHAVIDKSEVYNNIGLVCLSLFFMICFYEKK